MTKKRNLNECEYHRYMTSFTFKIKNNKLVSKEIRVYVVLNANQRQSSEEVGIKEWE